MKEKLYVYTHPLAYEHDTGPGHPERTDRLDAILPALRESSFSSLLNFVKPRKITLKELLRGHSKEHVEYIKNIIPHTGYDGVDPDTIVSPQSYEAALYSAGGCLQAVDEIVKGKIKRAFCAGRPPGHHATKTRAMGFCLFSNIALAACHALKEHGMDKVAIVDFDVHHGNGTQDVITENQHILFISLHEYPNYPMSGTRQENVENHILNVPMASRSTGTDYKKAFKEEVIPALRKFEPELLFISAGFDAHQRDPLASIELEDDDFGWMTEQLVLVANDYCKGRVISTLEGGYDLIGLRGGVLAHIQALLA